ncbi:MAG: HNH endonuclease [Candidatus Izemoplasmatales bacterium]|jgi:hypothetical protein|nr:MAG: hypothetical protein YFSK_2710 [Candidatus Yanofskybacteria bacterium]
MEYIVSRNYKISTDVFESNVFFNIWIKKMWPYDDAKIGDTIYWYDRMTNKINYQCKIVKLKKFKYSSKNELLDGLVKFFGHLQAPDYLKKKASKGYCLCYKIGKAVKVDFYRPAGIFLPQLGWLKVDDEIKSTWLNRNQFKIADEKSLNRIGNRDVVRKAKEKCDYRCQFPNCGIRIKTKNGYYAEAAHIVPVRDSGKTKAENLIVLCPNHHKEFDLGELEITQYDKKSVCGVLNGKKFKINLEK